jgi:hypothetical protein
MSKIKCASPIKFIRKYHTNVSGTGAQRLTEMHVVLLSADMQDYSGPDKFGLRTSSTACEILTFKI